jgi:predicted DNA-binding transcriptional regulator AlpA
MRELISIGEVAYLLSIHKASVWRYVRAGTLPRPIHISKQCRRWRRSEIEAAISVMEGR